MTRIFISYRRGDTASAAMWLHQGLTRWLPDAHVLVDVASLVPAADWMRQVVETVRLSDWVVVLIGHDWLERGLEGKLRLEDRSDVVRLEVATAIAQGIPILPVTVDDAPLPPSNLLPLDVARLVRFQRETLSSAGDEADIRRIATLVKEVREDKGRPAIPPKLTGFWSHTTADSGSSYEFSADGTYVYSGILNQQRPSGQYTFEVFEEGIVDVEARTGGLIHLQPLRASANQKDSSRPETNYHDSPRELVDKALAWRILATTPPRLVLRASGEPETSYHLEWRERAPGPAEETGVATVNDGISGNSSGGRCYVAMPFGERVLPFGQTIDFDLIYASAVRPAVEAAGLTPLRPDNVVSTGTVSRAVIDAVARADVMIADLSAPSHYVSYELGMRHGLVPGATLILLAEGADQLANLLDVQTLRYRVPRGPDDPALNDLRERLTEALRPGGDADPVDSPFFRLFPVEPVALPDDPRDMQRREQAETLRARLLDARRARPVEEGIARLQELERDADAAGLNDDRMRVDLMLAYRDFSEWDEVIRIIAGFPPGLAASPTVVQQNALAHNRRDRPGDSDRAEQALRQLLERIGPDSETYGLLGRVYKDRYQRTASRPELLRAIDAYRQGWLADQRDIYPGINLATLLTLAGGKEAEDEARRVVHELRGLVDPRIDSAPADYWDVATGLELAVLDRDWERADELIEPTRARAASAWMLESTANNLQILATAMPDPRDRQKMQQVVRELLPEAVTS